MPDFFFELHWRSVSQRLKALEGKGLRPKAKRREFSLFFYCHIRMFEYDIPMNTKKLHCALEEMKPEAVGQAAEILRTLAHP
ncbi:MAG: hypothetical protein ABFR90_11880, partial [Planctomycetota bacterium]